MFKAIVSAVVAVAVAVLAVAVPGGQPLAALATSAFWGSTAISAGAAAAATITLDTGEGRQFQRHFANEVFDDALGFSPRAAAVASSVVSHAGLTWGFEQLGAQMFLDPGKAVPTNKLAKDANVGPGRTIGDLAQQGQGGSIRTLVNRAGQEFNLKNA